MVITYETAKRLREFLGPTFPLPENNEWWGMDRGTPVIVGFVSDYAAYTLEDLLSRPFCEAMAKEMIKHDKGYGFIVTPHGTHIKITKAYWDGGLPAVEAVLVQMMGKR